MPKILNRKLRRYLDHVRNKFPEIPTVRLRLAAETGTKRAARMVFGFDKAAWRRLLRRVKIKAELKGKWVDLKMGLTNDRWRTARGASRPARRDGGHSGAG